MQTKAVSVESNQLLGRLPRRALSKVLVSCVEVELVFREVLAEAGAPIRQVLFPLQSIISLTASIGPHQGLEVGLIGDEGMLGATLLLGVDLAPLHALVQGQGSALSMSRAQFLAVAAGDSALHRILSRYLYVLMQQLAQTAACTRFHVVEARLARWLLMTHDRTHADGLHVTQEFLAWMLGVRRVGVTTAAGALQRRQLIHYARGEITILDRIGLEAAACSCYEADRATYAAGMN
ncbi:Crp/Fnr family transcriptional regulator [Niveibacterium sp. 24ML]|uniref:Crp/Fnr family transcriptional regulator n=1 Tax=Niveibacterium sp. 24ML TaxID=2985512 RepID=UPI0022722306|nr:Crp/Fnr family transcriptional regulator [Niveibacterium sp. 24ML]MCX9155604.1 Crp/Fnr family transcriptional regulator [Niveibacterium sp. 24ML]